ncbi:MAG: helix-turn-helix transcriptional regulator, partial [Candidatus Portnoybacteria bacterium]|nr:helix-turn-helix transcriptional regulator [Candidatus Portnoybacteria bacterium]
AELARKAGMHAPHLSDIISGKRKIGRAVAVRLANVLQIPPEHILFVGHTPRDGADVEALYSKMESSFARRNGFLRDALKTLKEAQSQKDKECIAAMKHAMHFISLAIEANPTGELSSFIRDRKENTERRASRIKK